MTQPVSYQVPAHPSGLDMRTQLNVIVLALLGDNVGPTQPPEMYPGMMWGDTTAGKLKRRTNANDSWIVIGPLDDFLGDVRKAANDATAAAANKVTKTGDTMTGHLYMQGNVLAFSNPAGARYGYLGPFATPGAADSGMGFVNSAWTAWNLQSLDDGRLSIRNMLTVQAGGAWIWGRLTVAQTGAYGEIGFRSTDGTCQYLRGRGAGGGMEWVNNAYNAVIGTMDDAGNHLVNGRLQAGQECWAGNGNGKLATNGDVWGTVWGNQWLSAWLGSKANNGSQCQWNSGIAEFASAMGGANTSDSGNPWVMEGVRVTTSTDINRIYPRCIWLRNQ